MILREMSADDQQQIGKLFASGRGKEVLEILNRSIYNTISFTSGNTHISAFKEGQRDLVHILRQCTEAILSQET